MFCNLGPAKHNEALDIQSYLLRFGVLGMFLGSSHTFLGGGNGCLGKVNKGHLVNIVMVLFPL